jgi:hypothetical protein
LLLLAIGVGQMVLAMVFLRSASAPVQAEPVAAPAPAEPHDKPHEKPHAKPHAAKAEHAAPAHGDHEHELEVDLGSFGMTVPPSKGHPTLLVSFHLYGTIGEAQQAEFHEKYESFQHRIRQEVLLAVRHSNLDALTDPSLTDFKRDLLTRINRVLGKAALGDLIFSDVAILEP